MQDYSPQQSVHKTPRHSIGFFYILPLGLLCGFILFVISYFVKGGRLETVASQSVSPTPIDNTLPTFTPTPVVTQTATPTSMPEEETNTNSPIRVLNGSGLAGAAGKIASEVEVLGYTNVRTGNADSYTYQDITIRTTADNNAAAEKLKQALEKTHSVTLMTDEDLPSGVDIEVIVGK
jgi:hypothetical protein